MEISFANPKLQKLCESEKALQAALGADGGRRAMRRLSDLHATPTLEDMRNLPGRIHELDADRKGQLAIDLSNGKRLVIRPTNGWPDQKDAGASVWQTIEAVEIVEITNYH